MHVARAATVLALFSNVWLPAQAGDAPSAPGPRGFVLCMADDQGYGDVGFRGHPHLRTPVLDEMAATGVNFERFYAAAPVCSPTRASVLTGRHPARMGCFRWGHRIRPEESTLAEALRAVGYATGHFGKWHLGSVRAGDPTSPGENGFEEWVSSPNFYDNDPLMSRGGEVVRLHGESSMVTVEAALEFIGRAVERKRPFLAVVWFGNPHVPHRPSAELEALYEDLPPRERRYLAEVTGIDRAMGRLRRGLRRLGVARDTLVWYTSDNGSRPPGSAGGLRGRKGTLFEGGIRVPAMIEWPAGLPEPRRIGVPCCTTDVFPTVLALAGVRPEREVLPLDGIDLSPLLRAGRSSPPGIVRFTRRTLGFWDVPVPGRPVRSEKILRALAADPEALPADVVPPPAVPEGLAALPGPAAWIEGRYKLLRRPMADGTMRETLYDLQRDPTERVDLARERAGRLAAMRERLLAWQRSVCDSLGGADYRS